ncbi:F0F1 ATP synthase subunit delta [uncultured Friedmanniella sp.]|uniref:F0F1 ATP synthase subunit delta n=1 Tax=uncultured Friedmanniella sp. TaxID=335381 RepID=UPI0035CB1A92
MSAGSEARLEALDEVLDRGVASARSTEDGVLATVASVVTRAPSAGDVSALPGDLFAVVDALDSSVTLRRALTDPGVSETGRQQLIHRLLDGRVSKLAVQVVVEAVTMRWGGGRTLAAALERQAVRAQLLVADRDGNLEETEDELFRFARVVESTPEVRDALSDRGVDLAGRRQLVADLLTDRANPSTVVLAARAVAARERTFAHTIEGFVALAAAQKNRVVATVRVARPLTTDQRSRLQAALRRQVGRDVALQEVLDSDVLGGVRVELGDEVIEGTVAGRLESARRLFG